MEKCIGNPLSQFLTKRIAQIEAGVILVFNFDQSACTICHIRILEEVGIKMMDI